MARSIRNKKGGSNLKGAIIGDIIGSAYEFNNTNTKSFPLFSADSVLTDDSVMTLAVAESIMKCWEFRKSFDDLDSFAVSYLHRIGRRYPFCGYGGRFFRWMMEDVWAPYYSYGNGAAMRISAVGDIAKSVEEAKALSEKVTAITHNHPEGIKGAEACAVAKVLLKQGKSKEEVREYVQENYYDLSKTVDQYRKENNGEHGAEICQVSVPQAFVCLFEGADFEDVIRNCISIGGDSDTIAAIAGGIAEAIYPVPKKMEKKARKLLPEDLLNILDRWEVFRESWR